MDIAVEIAQQRTTRRIDTSFRQRRLFGSRIVENYDYVLEPDWSLSITGRLIAVTRTEGLVIIEGMFVWVTLDVIRVATTTTHAT